MVAEDRDFNIDYLSRAEKLRLIPYAGYYYQSDHEGSLSKRGVKNKLQADILYWNKLARLLDGTNETYLAHRLYFFFVDNVSELLQQKEYSAAIHSLRVVHPLFDRSFLRRNMKAVHAPAWQKALVKMYLR